MADILESGDERTPIPLRVIVGAVAREIRSALFLAINSPDVRLVATASTVAELVTHTRSFQPDAVVIADDLLAGTDRVASIGAIEETMSRGRVFVLGPSAAAIGDETGVASVEESSDLLERLLATGPQSTPPRDRGALEVRRW